MTKDLCHCERHELNADKRYVCHTRESCCYVHAFESSVCRRCGTLEGIKHDQLKHKWHLLPWRAAEVVVEVLMHGAEKYSPENWRKVEGGRYFDAAIRHLVAYNNGEKTDPESGKSHLAHAATCVLFMLELDL